MPSTAHVNLNLTTLGREGWLKEALHSLLTTHKSTVDSNTYLQLLHIRMAINAFSQGKKIYSLITCRGAAFSTGPFFQNKLISMYVKCGGLLDARKVFDEMTERNGFSWNAMIAGYRRNGYPYEALRLFRQMEGTGNQPDEFTFASIISACAKIGDLEQGMEIHQRIIERGFALDVVVVSGLIDMYAKSGSIQKARELFDKIPKRNVVSWNAMIAGYARNGILDEALRIFKEIPERDVVSWNAIISGYVQNGFVEKAWETFKQMHLAGVKPISTTFASILPACAKMGALEQGMDIHQSITKNGCLSDVVVASALVDMYAKCGSIQKARKVFDKMSQRDAVSWNAIIAGYTKNGFLDEALRFFNEMPSRHVISWNAMIAGYAQNGFVEKALETFKQMQLAGEKPNSETFATILPPCAKMRALEQGMEVHQRIIESGYLLDIVVVSAMVDMYAKCGSIERAREVFNKMSRRDAVSWNAMIAGYAQNGVLGEALTIFKEMPQRNVVSWNAIIAGYAQNGLIEMAMETFKQMKMADVMPNSATFASILPACATMGTLEQGMEIHQSIIEIGLLSDGVVASALLDMYAKCGSIQKARELFDKMSERDAVSWNVMITGHAMHGFHNDALKLFELMKHSGTYPDHVCFISVLFACSHAGLVDEGCKYFHSISDSYCIIPTMDHYACMVDLLGRADYLEEALNFIIKMPIKPAMVVWMCLLGTCRSHKNIGLGIFTSTLIIELDTKNTVPNVLLSNIYAEVGRRGDVQMVRRSMKDKGIKKLPGRSWIQVH